MQSGLRDGARGASSEVGDRISVTVTTIAPPIRVAICANGINCIRFAAVRIATSPVPPCPLWQAFTIAVSIGYIFIRRPTTKPVPISVATVDTIVTTLTIVNAAVSLSQGVIATPIANSSVTAVEKNL